MLAELLNLLGFDPEGVEKEKTRIDRAFSILGIGTREISQGNKRIEQFFDIELLGVRKVLGLWVKELVDLVLAKDEGKRVIYVSLPGNERDLMSLS